MVCCPWVVLDLGRCEGGGVMSFMEQTCFVEAAGREGTKDLPKVCYMRAGLPLNEPQRLMWSVGLGTCEGSGARSCMEQVCFLAAAGREGSKGLALMNLNG